VDESTWLPGLFEEHRARLHSVAYRMLGSASEADDAVQETWIRLGRTDTGDVENLGGWLTTVLSRVCLNMLRTREHQREEPFDADVPDQPVEPEDGGDPEQETVLAEAVGLALLVVLDTLTPPERLAFVLHDMFAVPFDEIGPMLERSPAAVRQLASRARRRVRGSTPAPEADRSRQRRVVDAFLAATRGGDFEALVALLHPDVVLRADPSVVPSIEPVIVLGGHTVARGAMAAVGRAQFTEVALVNGTVGLVMAPAGKLRLVLSFTLAEGLITEGLIADELIAEGLIAEGLITEIDVVADPGRLGGIEIAVLDATYVD
jgi:RNA polymerase sigma factor (sigma-70 family)